MNSSIRHTAVIQLLMASSLVTTVPSMAATTTTPVTGSLGPTEQACLQQLTTTVGLGENCMYDGGPSNVPSAPGSGEITGPFSQIYYYDYNQNPAAFSVTFVPTHNSGQISQVMNGTVTIDDNDTLAETDDRISFSLTLTSPLGGDIIRLAPGQAVVLFERAAVDLTRTPKPTPPPTEVPPGDPRGSLFPGLVKPPVTQVVAIENLLPGTSRNHTALTDDVNGDGSPDWDADGDGVSDMFDADED